MKEDHFREFKQIFESFEKQQHHEDQQKESLVAEEEAEKAIRLSKKQMKSIQQMKVSELKQIVK